MSDNTMPEHIFAGRIYDYVEAPSFASSWYEDEPLVGLTEYIRADVARAQIARAEDMATQAIEAWRKATAAHDVYCAHLAAANARIAKLEAAKDRLPNPLREILESEIRHIESEQ